MNTNGYREQAKHPGKFEGEPAYVPYYYDQSLYGGFNQIHFSDEETVLVTQISLADARRFPELEHLAGRFFAFYETNDGFVHHEIVDRKQVEVWEAQAMANAERQEEA